MWMFQESYFKYQRLLNKENVCFCISFFVFLVPSQLWSSRVRGQQPVWLCAFCMGSPGPATTRAALFLGSPNQLPGGPSVREPLSFQNDAECQIFIDNLIVECLLNCFFLNIFLHWFIWKSRVTESLHLLVHSTRLGPWWLGLGPSDPRAKSFLFFSYLGGRDPST